MSQSTVRIRVSSFKGLRLLAALLPVAAIGAVKLDSRGLAPATQPSKIPASLQQQPPPAGKPLPAPFSTLMKRSIFARNGIAAVPPGTNPGPPEAMLALRGIVYDDTSFLVFIEDTGSHRTLQLKPGDTVAGGKVGQISLDDFGYEAGGNVTQVRVGQNLLGAALPPVAAAPRPGPPPGPDGPQGPPDAKPPPGPIFEIGPNGQRVRNLAKERADLAASKPAPG